MLSNIFVRLLTSSIRPVHNYQQHFLRLLSTTDSMTKEQTSTNREAGIVKRFSKDKGYGFITKTSDGVDCFVHFKNINTTGFKTLEQGQEVEFTVVQSEKGVEAKDVNITNAETNQSSESSYNNSTSSRFGFGRGGLRKQSSSSAFEFGGNKSSERHSEDQDLNSTEKIFNFNTGLRNSTTDNLFSSRRTQTDQKRQIGSIKRWTNERGFGFIRRNDGGPDLFCHIRSVRNGLQELQEGQTVEYRVHKTDKGDEARDVTLLNEDAEQQQQQVTTDSNERQTGTVKRWLSEKGYGFLRRDGGAGSDVFVHLRDLNDGITSLEEGQTVEFDIKNSEKGDTAHNVIVRND